jgi:TIR domain-containing protein
MSFPRIFVSYPLAGDEQGMECARRFMADLKANGAEVVTDDEHISDEHVVGYLNGELASCDYLVLIQTPHSLHSLRVQSAVNLAVLMATQQSMKGVLRLVAVSYDDNDEQPLWNIPHVFDARKDYPRARDKALLELGLLSLDAEEWDQITSESVPVCLPTALETPSAVPDRGQDTLLPPGSPASPLAPLLPIPSQHSDLPPTISRKFGLAGQRWWVGILAGMVTLVLLLGVILHSVQVVHYGGTVARQTLAPRQTLAQSTATKISSSPSAMPSPSRTPTPSTSGVDPRSTVTAYRAGGTLVLSNDLTVGNDNTRYQWDVSPSGQAHGCYFTNHTYDMSSRGLNYCVANNTNFANFVYQIQVKIVQGQAGGIIFRTNDGAAQTYYIFEITVDGHFFIQRNDSSEADAQLSAGRNVAIKTGFNQPNLLAVEANGSQMMFSVNGHPVAQLTDSHYSSGIIGVIVGEQTDTQSITEAAYNYARVWIL